MCVCVCVCVCVCECVLAANSTVPFTINTSYYGCQVVILQFIADADIRKAPKWYVLDQMGL